MPLTDEQQRTAAREFAHRVFVEINATATMNLDDIKAAVASVDGTMDALPATLNAVQTIKTNFIQRLPEPFKSASTANQKAVVLMVWAMKEVGII